MIKAIEHNHEIVRKVPGKGVYFRTTFVADSTSDVAGMNAEGSDYLNYPAGSAVICTEDKKLYMLNASEYEYKEV